MRVNLTTNLVSNIICMHKVGMLDEQILFHILKRESHRSLAIRIQRMQYKLQDADHYIKTTERNFIISNLVWE